ncbi:16S rRNA (guanine(527)-N(7))-methyltransferase RsmG [Tropicimonas sp. S265A]|uniref:16S rRNA (guanine(527)-N(7))-methyltransferase RsmG n=1 Tax=Tropicimonas sp. S265A TaxID=3415134 RepID=UPI003C7D242A
MTLPSELGLDVSRETMDRLEAYVAILQKWNPKINLVASNTLSDVWVRHIYDSAQVFKALRPTTRHWVDLGSGGGFPGLVVGLLAHEAHPELNLTLIESDLRKATFLRTVIRETGISARVLSDRIEEAPPQAADVVSARALAPLPKLLGYVARHLAEEGVAVLLKGENAKSEVSEARKYWHFSCEETPSLTESRSVVLKLRDLRNV